MPNHFVAVIMELSPLAKMTQNGYPRYGSKAAKVNSGKPVVFSVIDKMHLHDGLETSRKCIFVGRPFAYPTNPALNNEMVYAGIDCKAQISVIG